MKIVECPRDAIQGLKHFIQTEKKIEYLNLLLESNLFDTIDFGSFVSSKAIPQMADTPLIVPKLRIQGSKAKLLAIIANERGASDACHFEEITYLGYPFSISETFQRRNTNATIAESFERVKFIQDLCLKHRKELVIYISMGFGNPYGDAWNAEIALHWVEKFSKLGIKIVSLADTVGIATPELIKYLFENLVPKYPALEFGSHLHSNPANWRPKIEAAYEAGCRRFDGAILGYGGCPMAEDELVGNMATENLISFLKEKNNLYVANNQEVIKIKEAFQQLVAS